MSTGGCIPVFLRFFGIFRAEIPSHFAFSISYSCEQFYQHICSNYEQMPKNLMFTNKHISMPKKQKPPHRKQMLLVRGFLSLRSFIEDTANAVYCFAAFSTRIFTLQRLGFKLCCALRSNRGLPSMSKCTRRIPSQRIL